jgi:N-formylglutamate deformylase
MDFSQDPTLSLPVVIVRLPAPQTAAVVFASPHSGRAYPAEFLDAARLDPLRLRRSEDCFVDELFAAAPDHGAPLLAASFPRAYCDVNREAWELDPEMFEDDLPVWVNSQSPRVAAGLGTIARVVASGEPIYRRPLRFAEAEERIRTLWQPFHAALRAHVDATRATFGTCLLVDCHSMPGNCMPPKRAADIVLGDGHGTTCDPRYMCRLEGLLRAAGFEVRRNDPYAGGYITRHYGRPREKVSAVQIEVNRGLYMDETRFERLAGFADVQARLTSVIAGLTVA